MENTNSNFSPVFSGRVLWVGLTPARDYKLPTLFKV